MNRRTLAASRPRRRAPWCVLVDTREQAPWPLVELIEANNLPFTVEVATLRTGDYVLREAPHLIVERKNLGDLVGCVGHGRERFERELARLESEARQRFVLVEASVADVERHQYRADAVKPAHVLGSVAGWSLTFGVHFWFCGSPTSAAAAALRLFGIVRSRMLRTEDADELIAPASVEALRA